MVVTFPPMTTRDTDLRVVYPPALTSEQARLRALEHAAAMSPAPATGPIASWLGMAAFFAFSGLAVFSPETITDAFAKLFGTLFS
jgi:hypothetical protein